MTTRSNRFFFDGKLDPEREEGSSDALFWLWPVPQGENPIEGVAFSVEGLSAKGIRRRVRRFSYWWGSRGRRYAAPPAHGIPRACFPVLMVGR